MLSTEIQRAVLASTAGVQSSNNKSIRFRVNGYDIATSEATTRWVEGSYVDWLVANSQDEVNQGRPILLKTSPKYFYRLIRRLRSDYKLSRSIDTSCSWLREERIRHLGFRRLRKKRRHAMDPPPFTTRRIHIPQGKQIQVCKIKTPLPTHVTNIHSTAPDAVEAIMESMKMLWSQSKSYFDRLVVLLTIGHTLSGSPLIWPYLYHLFDSRTSNVSDTSLVENEEISEMDPEELEVLYQSVDISPELQHQVKLGMRFKGYSCMFSDMKLDLNNYSHWRIARATDRGVRSLDDACTVLINNPGSLDSF